MKTKSIQQSLLEEIFGLDQAPSHLFFLCESATRKKDHHTPQLEQRPLKSQQPKPSDCSINQLQHEILRMRLRAAKVPGNSRDAQHNPKLQKKVGKNIKTEHCPEDVGPSINYSTIYTRRSSLDESMHDRALRDDSMRKNWVDKKQKQLQQQELKECSYHPLINPTSKEIMSRLDKEQIYQKLRKKKQESMKKIIEQAQLKEMKECSFTPNIQQSQKKLIRSVKVERASQEENEQASKARQPSRHSISIFDHLYEDSKTRQIKSKKLEESYINQMTNKPRLDDISRQITKNTNFEERRLAYEQKKRQKEMEIKQKENKCLRDSYRPSINSTSHHRSKEVPIGEYLYLQSKRDATPKHDSKIAPGDKPTFANKKSTKVYQQRKTLVFYQIFKLLDGKESGSISTTNLNLQLLPREVVKIIYPLIEELEVMEVELQEHEFVHSISNLFKSLTVHEKDTLLGFIGGGTSKQEEKELFKPRLNKRSKMIAACNQRSQMSIYEFCSIKEVERQKMLESERVQKSKRELENCTFQPNVLPRR